MTPSNPSNSKPLIYRICDALGVFHIVAPVNHTHSQAEIDGLAAALAAKANAADVQTALAGKQNNLTFDTIPTDNSTNPVTSGGVKTALDGKADQVHTHSAIGDGGSSITVGEGEINIELSDPTTHSGGEVDINVSKLPNLQRAIDDPDTTPTLNSNNLVTSGGVRVAIEEKLQGIVPDITGIGDGDSMNLDTLEMTPPSVRRFIIQKTGSSAIPFRDMFYSENLPVHISGDDTLEIGVGEYVMVSVFRENSSEHEHINCYFVLFEGIFEE